MLAAFIACLHKRTNLPLLFFKVALAANYFLYGFFLNHPLNTPNHKLIYENTVLFTIDMHTSDTAIGWSVM
jgi:hypothetical protein